MNKLIIGLVVGVLMSFGAAQSVEAGPFKAENNPQIVANYDSGPHGIPGESEHHVGADVVLQAGKSGNFIQWFVGHSDSEGHHGEHSVWKVKKDNQDCKDNWLLYPQPNPDWGDYLVENADYCVMTNDYLVGKH
jgi:hypothetical protein